MLSSNVISPKIFVCKGQHLDDVSSDALLRYFKEKKCDVIQDGIGYFSKWSDSSITDLGAGEKRRQVAVVPGGKAMYLAQCCATELEKVKAFVDTGGNYLGICAGGIVATKDCSYVSKIENARGDVFEFKEPLFFDCSGMVKFSCNGPVFSNPVKTPVSWQHAESIDVYDDARKALQKTFYLNGPHFNVTGSDCFKVVKHYSKEKDYPAVVVGRHSELSGKIILSGVHPEILPSDINYQGSDSDYGDLMDDIYGHLTG